MAQVIWTPKALEDLESLLDYIARDALATARRYAQKLLSRVDLLASHPGLGGFVPEVTIRTYREIRLGSHRSLYRSDGHRVLIVALYHAARLLEVDDLG